MTPSGSVNDELKRKIFPSIERLPEPPDVPVDHLSDIWEGNDIEDALDLLVSTGASTENSFNDVPRRMTKAWFKGKPEIVTQQSVKNNQTTYCQDLNYLFVEEGKNQIKSGRVAECKVRKAKQKGDPDCQIVIYAALQNWVDEEVKGIVFIWPSDKFGTVEF